MKTRDWIVEEIAKSLSLAEHFDKHKFSGKMKVGENTVILDPHVMTLLHKLRADTLKEVLDDGNEPKTCEHEYTFSRTCGVDVCIHCNYHKSLGGCFCGWGHELDPFEDS